MISVAGSGDWGPWEVPVTWILLFLCIGPSGWLKYRKVSIAVVCNSYDKVVEKREFWRLAFSPVVHSDVIHLLLNVLCVWANRELEIYFGSLYYLRKTFLLVLLTNGIHLWWIHRIAREGTILERLRQQYWIGFSGVLFAWHIVHISLPYWSEEDSYNLFGFIPIPVGASPMVLMFFTQSMVHKTSLVNHICGLVAGYLVAFGLFDWLTPYFSFCVLQWFLVLLITSKGFPPSFDTEEALAIAEALPPDQRTTNDVNPFVLYDPYGINEIEIELPEQKENRNERNSSSAPFDTIV